MGAGATPPVVGFFGLLASDPPESVSSMWQRTMSEVTAFGSVDHVGVMTDDTITALASTGFEVGAVTGEVTGLGKGAGGWLASRGD